MTTRAGTARRLLSVTWPILFIMSAMLILSLASVSMTSSLRAYVNALGVWTKSEFMAVASLRRYAQGAPEREYRRFEAKLPHKVKGVAIRVIGKPSSGDNPAQAFASFAELSAH